MRVFAALLMLLVSAQDDEMKKRDAFTREFKDKAPAKRVEAVGKMHGSVEDKSIVAVAIKLPAKMRESPVGLRHFVRVVTLLDGISLT
jgi:hypothetical protein